MRNFAAAPLLLAGLAISYALVASLQAGPIPEERTAWIAGMLISAAFALYLFAGYFLVVARKYVVMAILTLWACHLFVLSPFLAPCEGYRNLDRFRQAMGFGLREFALAIALLAIASSVGLYLRYRAVKGSPLPSGRRFLRFSVAGATLVSVALVAAVYWMVPLLRKTHDGGPLQTLVLFLTYPYWMVLPLACVTALHYVMMRDQYAEAQLRIALDAAVGLIILLNVATSAFVSAVLGPLRTLGCAV